MSVPSGCVTGVPVSGPVASRSVPDEPLPPRPPRYDVVGIGNALVDVIAHASDDFIAEHALVKGAMTLIDTDRAVHLYSALGSAVEMSGGSAANTAVGVASLGGRAAYIGKVSDDDLGMVFGHDLRAVGVQFRPGALDQEMPTGRCIIVVTPDAQRTMNTYLGTSSLLCSTDIDEGTVADGAVLYMEGYLYDRDEAKEAFRKAAGVAHAHGRRVSLTLSDSFCVDRHRDDFRALVRDEVDLLFGNEDEIVALYEASTLDEAIERVRRRLRSDRHHHRARRAAWSCDPTASSRCRLSRSSACSTPPAPATCSPPASSTASPAQMPLRECARIGAVAAAEVIAHVGPRPLVELRTLIS